MKNKGLTDLKENIIEHLCNCREGEGYFSVMPKQKPQKTDRGDYLNIKNFIKKKKRKCTLENVLHHMETIILKVLKELYMNTV